MTQELIDALIAHYEMVINRIKYVEDIVPIDDFLIETSTVLGICYCASRVFNKDIGDDDWILSKTGGLHSYIAEKPFGKESKEEVIKLLQIRLDILKQFPN